MGFSLIFPTRSVPPGLIHQGTIQPGHYPAFLDTFLIPPSGSIFCSYHGFTRPSNMNLGIPVWHIDPPASISHGLRRPYHALTTVQPFPMTSATASVPSQPQ